MNRSTSPHIEVIEWNFPALTLISRSADPEFQSSYDNTALENALINSSGIGLADGSGIVFSTQAWTQKCGPSVDPYGRECTDRIDMLFWPLQQVRQLGYLRSDPPRFVMPFDGRL